MIASPWAAHFITLFCDAKPLPEAGNNYLGSECDHLKSCPHAFDGGILRVVITF
jgi:hypothetical protein